MHPARIAKLLEPFLAASLANDPVQPAPSEAKGSTVNDALYQHISTYIDILLRWNARISLTAIRDPEEIVTRHFGESLFAARHLFPKEAHSGDRERAALQGRVTRTEETGALAPGSSANDQRPGANDEVSAADLGSGAGFPGIPIKLWAPPISLTLIESNQKKTAFLREVLRSLTLTNVNVFSGRAEQLLQQRSQSDPAAKGLSTGANQQTLDQTRFDLVTLRAVEHFAAILPVAASLVSPGGRLALLIGTSQLDHAQSTLPTLAWDPPIPVPQSQSRTLLIARVS
jgi:16S rRNA (guanine527-N7)-methyltransferase